MSKEGDEQLEQLAEIARAAGQILLGFHDEKYEVELKSENDPVTEADKRANDYLVAELTKRFPGDGIVAEETADQTAALAGGRCWYVDPLDGTKEFIKKNGEFAVMIGLADDGAAKLGAVYQPLKDKLYLGEIGAGATLEEKGTKRQLKVSNKTSDLTLVVSRSHRPESIDEIAKSAGVTNEIKSGSVGLKVGLIAEKKADLYVHLSDRSYAWDACGPEAIIRAAGGRFCDASGKPFHYGGEDLRTVRGIFASNEAAFAQAIKAATTAGQQLGFLKGPK